MLINKAVMFKHHYVLIRYGDVKYPYLSERHFHKTYRYCVPMHGSVVVDFLFIVTPIEGVCNCSMFC